MAKYLIGEVEQITGVKAHTLRYWEKVIPGFSPQKDYSGKRLYSQREIAIIIRLKNLIQVQGMSVDKARRQLLQDAEVMEAELAALTALHDIRAELTAMYKMLKKTGENYAKSRTEQQDRT